MGIGQIGIPSLILILIVALVIFGPKKLPEIGKAAGQTLTEFKKSTSGMLSGKNEDESAEEEEENRK